MTRLEKGLSHTANILVGGTGLVYAWMRYGLRPLDSYAVVHHPWQPFVQHAHVWVSPLLVLMIGHLVYHHAWIFRGAGMKEGRRSGTSLLAIALPMICSGYFIQTAVSDVWRNVWIVVHCGAATLWMTGYAVHFATHRFRRRREPGG